MARGAGERPRKGAVRCAIYTRKSTEEGLDQAFNSLDAQREACEAYIKSQRHEGWTLVKDDYDDGGFSGGNMDRPGLKRLLSDVEAGRVDVIVVYKVDRLTRALSDFAKIVEILDAKGASFVSVTQAFNTTTSMGRLTLNVLLSFAQFEREVTGERIRDKVAASKKKGIWMGGNVPLGYEVRDRKLVINEAEAQTVRLIYHRYLELRSVHALSIELAERGIRTKKRVFADGRIYGDRRFSSGALAHLLKNVTYVGELRHKEERYPGEHQAIIDRDIWEEAQRIMLANGSEAKSGARAEQPSLLAGMIVDGEGRPMTPSHATRPRRRYRYYITRRQTGIPLADAWRVPAGEIEPLVATRLASWLEDRAAVMDLAREIGTGLEQRLVEQAAELATRIPQLPTSAFRIMLLDAEARVNLHIDKVEISLDPVALLGAQGESAEPMKHRITITTAVRITRRGQELRLSFPPRDHDAPARHDDKLLGLIAKAHEAHALLIERGAAMDKMQRAHLTRIARLKFLAPDIVSSIVDGRQPPNLTARHLLRVASLPIGWRDQREQLGLL